MLKEHTIQKTYWAITQNKPEKEGDKLIHWLRKNEKNNKSTHFSKETKNPKEKEIIEELIFY